MVVVTVGALPAQMVGGLGGEPGWTPNLDGVIAETLGLRAVSASSSPIPSLASLMTGVDSWTHGLVSHRSDGLRSGVQVLPQMLGGEWVTEIYFPRGSRLQEFGLLEGFGRTQAYSGSELPLSRLKALGNNELVWVHFPAPFFPWKDRGGEIARLPARTGELDRIERRWLMPYANPLEAIPSPLLAESKELYRHEVAWLDERLGDVFQALKANPRWSDLTLLVTALHGNELGEHGQVFFAQNLQRTSIEVPLLIKLGAAVEQRVAKGGGPPSTAGIVGTVLEISGTRPPPALAASFFEKPGPAMSSLLDHGGVNRLSAVSNSGSETQQVLWMRPYSPVEPELWAAQAVEAGLGSFPIRESPGLILRRLQRAFRHTVPTRGDPRSDPEIEFVRWLDDGRVEGFGEQPVGQWGAEGIIRRWGLFQSTETTPLEESRSWR
ncbi:MAG: hypothetical protein AAGF23_18820 [Acidobacteriota bacterium]